ncbi:hypothetical protein [Streptomyces goshikiensis]|uniref:hypothetical protein n=1 Tax=Streptomyces goshikiensis TaxID=1942 RepID=UPI0036963377
MTAHTLRARGPGRYTAASTSAINRVRTTAAPPPRPARGARSNALVEARQPGTGAAFERAGAGARAACSKASAAAWTRSRTRAGAWTAATAMPEARFEVRPDTGHMPQLKAPEQLRAVL